MQAMSRQLHEAMSREFADVRQRLDILEAVVRKNSEDIKRNSEDIRRNSADIQEHIAATPTELLTTAPGVDFSQEGIAP